MVRLRNTFASLAVASLFAFGAVSPARGQTPAPTPQPPQRTVTVLGEVDRNVVTVGEEQTIIDVVVAAQRRHSGALDKIVLLRPTNDAPLVIEINMLAMLKTGNMAQNVLVNENDIVIVPHKQLAAGDGDLATVVLGAGIAALPERNRAIVLAWCIENIQDAKRLHESIVELAKLGEQGRVGCRALAAKLKGELLLAREAATALGMLGNAGKEALDDLRRCETHDDKQLRERCKAAIRSIESAVAKKAAELPPR